jgi:hypothetical protein
MEDNNKLLESLLDTATDYGKTSYELAKLKAIDKTTDIVSSLAPHAIVIIILSAFTLFLTLGLALWFGEITGKTFYGFFIVAGVYIITGIAIHFLMHKRIKRHVSDYLVKQLLK